MKPIVVPAALLLCTILAGCRAKPLPEKADYLWVANTSPINFGGLTELQPRDPDLGKPLYEGFFEPAVTGELRLTWPDARDPLFSPEAEWVLYFPHPEQLSGVVDEAEVELRGMIEGKWLHVLRRRGARGWQEASGRNNVIAEPAPADGESPMRMTVARLDEALRERRFNPAVEVWERSGGDGARDRRRFYAAFADTYPFLDTYGGNGPHADEGGRRPVAQLVGDVYREFRERAPEGARLVAINLSAHGAHAALVNDPVVKARLARENALLRTVAKPLGQFARVTGMKRLIDWANATSPPGVARCGERMYEVVVHADASQTEDEPVQRGTLHLGPEGSRCEKGG